MSKTKVFVFRDITTPTERLECGDEVTYCVEATNENILRRLKRRHATHVRIPRHEMRKAWGLAPGTYTLGSLHRKCKELGEL